MSILSEHVRFLGCEATYEEATTVIFGAPYDGTSSYRPGSRFAPQEIRLASDGLETWSPYQNRDLEDYAIHDAGDLVPAIGNSKAMLALVEEQTGQIIQDGKKPFMLGGEHLLSLGAVRALLKKYPDLEVLHFDAHTDLREEYLGEELSHATVIRQIWKLLGDKRIYTFGIRSGLAEEFAFAKKHLHFYPFTLELVEKALEASKLKDKRTPVYLTIDLDVLDPSVFPGTGTPEPGGVFFPDLMQAVFAMRGLNVVGMDLVELAPGYDSSGVSTLVAWKIMREALLALFND